MFGSSFSIREALKVKTNSWFPCNLIIYALWIFFRNSTKLEQSYTRTNLHNRSRVHTYVNIHPWTKVYHSFSVSCKRVSTNIFTSFIGLRKYLCYNTSHGNVAHTFSFSMVILGWILEQHIPVYLAGHTNNVNLDTRLIYWAGEEANILITKMNSLGTGNHFRDVLWIYLLSYHHNDNVD